MARVAFYAPLKPPGHPVPSGDRTMARNLMKAIAADGAQVDLVSELRVYDPKGDPDLQIALRKRAQDEVDRICTEFANHRPDLWVTYHNYYKAPDLIGPQVCRALNLPYVQIESTRAKRRLSGPWADMAVAAESASDAADLIFYVTDHDRSTLERDRPAHQTLVHLHPFLPLTHLPQAAPCDGSGRPILCVGMMRHGDKLASYQIIADTLARLGDTPWRLDIVGDGPARSQVQAMIAPYASQVRFLGQLDADALADVYHKAALFFWPGVNEAFGLVYLEAQAAGLPVVAQDRPGVRDVVLSGSCPTPEAGPDGLAQEISALMAEPELRLARGTQAWHMVKNHHLLGAATQTFWSAVSPLLKAKP